MRSDRWRLQEGGVVLVAAAMALASVAFAGDAPVAPPPAAGSCGAMAAETYYPCSSCHGAQGEGSEPAGAPALAAQQRDYVRRQLEHFRSGARGAHPLDVRGREMTLLARSLRDEAAVDAVACHVSAMPAATRPVPTVRGDARRGKALYHACAACHGDRGEGNAAIGSPSLQPLADWYVVAQLEAFRRGWRGTASSDSAGQQMRAAAALLRHDRDVRDVAAYVITLR